jgi:hypothetical protein
MISHGKTSPKTAKAPAKKQKKHAVTGSHAKSHETAHVAPAVLEPVIVEAGSRSKLSLRHLEEGTGPLVHEISQIVNAIHAAIPKPVPITIVYREKQSSSSTFGLFF